jgi:hypothetical protein
VKEIPIEMFPDDPNDQRNHGIKHNSDGTFTPFCEFCDWIGPDFRSLDTAKDIYRIHLGQRKHNTNAKTTRIAGWGKPFRKK